MTNVVLQLHSVTRTYGRRATSVPALRGVSLEVARGAFLAIMGPSGSGKSTLLHCASGLDRPTGGEVELDGVRLTTLSARALTELRRDRIGFVFQEYNLLPALTVERNIMLPQLLAGRKPRRAEVRQVLAWVGLDGMGRRRPMEMSGGQQQRVAIARALISRPHVLFADEPTGALDSGTARATLELFRRVVDERRQTIIMVTHDPVAASFADEVVFLADGCVVDRLPAPDPHTIAAHMAELETFAAAGRTKG